LQKFRWGDYSLDPATTYRFKVIPRYGKPGALETLAGLENGVEVEVTTEDPYAEETYVVFNRAAAASAAFNREFPDVTDVSDSSDEAEAARKWLSNGLEEALLAFMAKAEKGDALHAAIYEFQKPSLLKGLKDAALRGVEVKAVYHHRQKNEKDKTAAKNDAAVKAAGLDDETLAAENLPPIAKPRKSNPQSAIMHNKFVILLKNDGTKPVPKAVWSGSTNWTDGGLYGQLNVGHAVFDDEVAALYEGYFELLHDDADASTIKHALASLTPISLIIPGEHKVMPIFSPQSADTMLHLYANLCDGAKMIMVSAPFALSPIILAALTKKSDNVLRFMLLDKMGSLGKGEEVNIIEHDPSDSIAAATTISSPLHDFQGKLLEGKESFHHAGIHIHSKIILVDPFGSDPIIVTGSANFSNNSTEVNDSNSMILRGFTAVADIYATEFMRMFEHYHFRANEAKAQNKEKPLGLAEDDGWSDEYYVVGSYEEKDRRMFAGTF
jgi:phosphatidylserine/phosphatidylglycerophosphate/cardiolipin synthase-like enzyme